MRQPKLDTLRILFVSPRYPPVIGGAETHTAEVARRLAAGGHDVTVLTTDAARRLPPSECIEGVHVIRIGAWPAHGDLLFAPGLYRRIISADWDVVHCQNYNTLVPPLAMQAARRAKIPYVVTFHSGGHSSRLRNAIRPLQQLLLRPLLANAERLIGVSQFEASFFQRRLRLPADKFDVIPNGSHIPNAASGRAIERESNLILSVGRLERYKGHHRIVAAMPKVVDQYPGARLLVVGKGPCGSELRRQISTLGLEKHVELTSVSGTDRAGMAALLSRAALVVLLSDYEAHPIAVMEALSLQRPVLVAYSSGLAELADRGLVRAIPLRSSAEQVASAVLDNLRNPQMPPPLALPTWEECAGALETLYRAVASRRREPGVACLDVIAGPSGGPM